MGVEGIIERVGMDWVAGVGAGVDGKGSKKANFLNYSALK
jgi:hypothetical protein